MKKNQQRVNRSHLSIALCGLLSANYSQALNLPDVPLIVDAAEKPNIMMILDTSGSMGAILPEAPYVESDSYGGGACGRSTLSTSDTYHLRVNTDGTAQFSDGARGTKKSWAKNNKNYCFNPTASYKAQLFVTGNTTGKIYYSGNYLNWYFSNTANTGPATATEFGAGANKRKGTSSRIDVMKTVMNDLLTNTFTNAYVGLSAYDSPLSSGRSTGSNSYRAKVIEGLQDVDTNRATLAASVNGLKADGYTPLASSLAQIGRYFVEGFDLDLTPSSPYVSNQKAYALFNKEPAYADSSADKPNASKPGIIDECQSNYVISLTDGKPLKYDDTFNEDLAKWDDDDSDKGLNGGSNNKSDFDDVAAALYDIDLRDDLTGTQNIITHVVGLELNDPLLSDAAAAGGGSYFTTNNTSSLKTALATVFSNIQTQVGSIASVAFNSSQLDTGSAIFQAIYDTGDWTGTLSALPLDNAGNIGTASWEASSVLATIAPSNRDIFTYDDTANSGAGEGIPFLWASLNSDQKDDFYRSVDEDGDGISYVGSGVNDDDDAQSLLNFIRGDRSNEGNSATDYRTRGSALGDIVNSTPIYVGKPEMNWPEFADNNKFGASGTEYSTYKLSSTVQGRTPIVYVGANDGMLHGFNASLSGTGAGKEVFAYIPSGVFSDTAGEGLHYLADQAYRHKFYTDLTPVVSDVYIKRAASGSSAWRTILIGGLRAGGKGLFALDVSKPTEFSNPASYADDVVLWEFTDADDSDLGYTYGLPSIAMMANGKWAAIVGNGYNSMGGFAKLFIIYIEEGIDGWTAGEWVELDTGVGSDNGLSTPRMIDLDGDSVVDLIYAGDLKGNMWAFNVSSSNTSDWSDASNIRKLFTATDGSGNAQPITSAPLAAKNPNSNILSSAATPNLLIMFGTGKYLESTDNSSSNGRMTYYTVWDNGTNARTRSHLEPREIVSASDQRKVNGSAIDWNTQYGWYMDLVNISSAGGSPVDEGERIVADSLLRRSVLFFNTIITNTANCAISGGGWLMSLDFDSGLAPSFAVFDANGDGTINSSDIGFIGTAFKYGLPSKTGILGERQYTPGTDGTIDTRTVNVGAGNSEGPLSWTELLRD
ncbi:MAG: hypothetical protein JKY01_08100 [Pseudomonadales bacterium]|nr:hypothetical protein [Pseudomonadales bacterium]